jgi:predicted DNA-binding transcriptional regulator AlpA
VKKQDLPEPAASEKSATNTVSQFGTKRDVATMLQLSVRTIDSYLAQGMPHLKLGSRRCRFDLAETRTWFKQQFQTQRRAA